MDSNVVGQVRELCRQIDALESELAELIGSRRSSDASIVTPRKRRGRKPRVEARIDQAERRKGRPRKLRQYRCLDCNQVFTSNLPKLDAYCPGPACNKATNIEEID